ncbi:hypothetical protein [Propionimicrobium lymphophilum]|uniref:hypothetical protein n=1 Tax=Propionimicrobium lymphophilum TaxID=33012 RepID=UPI0023F4CAE1|nr:hypothetical protein [Propionimicrobium lymphophilum]
MASDQVEKTVDLYDLGVDWLDAELDTTGSRWLAIYLPVWLYTFTEVEKDVRRHYLLAVNGRTKETVGAVPYDRKKSSVVVLLAPPITFVVLTFIGSMIAPLLAALGLRQSMMLWSALTLPTCLFAFVSAPHFLNKLALSLAEEHDFRKETKVEVSNLKMWDKKILPPMNQNSEVRDKTWH